MEDNLAPGWVTMIDAPTGTEFHVRASDGVRVLKSVDTHATPVPVARASKGRKCFLLCKTWDLWPWRGTAGRSASPTAAERRCPLRRRQALPRLPPLLSCKNSI